MWLYTSTPWGIHNKHTTAGVHLAAEEQVEQPSRETAAQCQVHSRAGNELEASLIEQCIMKYQDGATF